LAQRAANKLASRRTGTAGTLANENMPSAKIKQRRQKQLQHLIQISDQQHQRKIQLQQQIVSFFPTHQPLDKMR
jgi:hypothetical protein